MTKKIKFLEDKILWGFRKDTEYKIKYEDEDYYLIERYAHSLCLFEKDNILLSYEIIEEPESLKTSALDDRIRIMSEYQYIEQQQGHPHAELMARAAEIAKTKIEWWEEFEFKAFDNMWHVMLPNTTFRPSLEYRLKPNTIKIGNREIRAPEKEPLKDGEEYYVPYFDDHEVETRRQFWGENKYHDETRLNNGQIFRNALDAIAAAEAMIELLRGDE